MWAIIGVVLLYWFIWTVSKWVSGKVVDDIFKER